MPASPSLLIVPARFKTGKLYTQIATTSAGVVLGSSGDFNVTRGTTATRFNSAGLIESVASGVPRLDYFTSGGTAGCPALLVEPSAQNLLLQSEAFNTTWSALNGATVTPNTIASPDNNVTADTINLSTTADSNVRQVITSSNLTAYTISCFFKNIALVAGETFRFRVNNANASPNDFIAGAIVDLAAGTATYFQTGTAGTGISGTGSASIENYGNGWFRVRATFTTGTAGGSATTLVQIIQPSASAARSFYAWGAQVETGSVATSYIPTTAAAVTRNADVVTLSGAVSGCIGQTEGTIYAEVDIRNMAKETYLIRIDEGATSNVLSLRTLTSNVVRTAITAPTFSGTLNISSATFTAGILKIAFAYKSGEIALCVNGANLTANGTFTFGASLNRITLGSNVSASSEFNDRIRSAALYTTRLTNAELQSLTTL